MRWREHRLRSGASGFGSTSARPSPSSRPEPHGGSRHARTLAHAHTRRPDRLLIRAYRAAGRRPPWRTSAPTRPDPAPRDRRRLLAHSASRTPKLRLRAVGRPAPAEQPPTSSDGVDVGRSPASIVRPPSAMVRGGLASPRPPSPPPASAGARPASDRGGTPASSSAADMSHPTREVLTTKSSNETRFGRSASPLSMK